MTLLDDLIEKLDKLEGRRVTVEVVPRDAGDGRGDTAESLAAALRRRKIVRER